MTHIRDEGDKRAMPNAKKVPVSERAIVARLRRALAKDGETLRKSRTPRTVSDLGDYFTVGRGNNTVVRRGIDVETLARELGVLDPFEEIVG